AGSAVGEKVNQHVVGVDEERVVVCGGQDLPAFVSRGEPDRLDGFDSERFDDFGHGFAFLCYPLRMPGCVSCQPGKSPANPVIVLGKPAVLPGKTPATVAVSPANSAGNQPGQGVPKTTAGPLQNPYDIKEDAMSFRVNTNLGALNALRNLGITSDEFSRSITRLSTGLRITTAADDPAGLIISENFRAQINGLQQAVQNNQDAINYAKTAEGALDEVSRLLNDARKLAVASGNTGALDSTAVQANQNQIQSILSSIDRIATQTQFGKKKLLDGSAGIVSTVTDAVDYDYINIGGTFGGFSVNSNGPITVQITSAATQASITGSVDLSANGLSTIIGAGSFVINGLTITTDGTETLGTLLARFNQSSNITGVNFGFDGTNVVLTQNTYGSNYKISFTDTAGLLNAAGNSTAAGTDAIATVTVTTSNGATTATFTGGRNGDQGLKLTDNYGNAIVLTEAGNTVGAAAAVGMIEAGSATFQIGANAGQTVALSLPNMMSSQL